MTILKSKSSCNLHLSYLIYIYFMTCFFCPFAERLY